MKPTSTDQNQMVTKQIEERRATMASLVPAQQMDLKAAFEKRITELEAEAARLDYHFDRRYVFRVLTMGHSQFAEYIGARGPNTHVNAACASTTHAVAIAGGLDPPGSCPARHHRRRG